MQQANLFLHSCHKYAYESDSQYVTKNNMLQTQVDYKTSTLMTLSPFYDLDDTDQFNADVCCGCFSYQTTPLL